MVLTNLPDYDAEFAVRQALSATLFDIIPPLTLRRDLGRVHPGWKKLSNFNPRINSGLRTPRGIAPFPTPVGIIVR
jgi:hypothetical protein